MIGHRITSRGAALAIRQAEEIVKGRVREASRKSVVGLLGRRLGRGLLAGGFLALCFLPLLTVLALITTAILLAR